MRNDLCWYTANDYSISNISTNQSARSNHATASDHHSTENGCGGTDPDTVHYMNGTRESDSRGTPFYTVEFVRPRYDRHPWRDVDVGANGNVRIASCDENLVANPGTIADTKSSAQGETRA